MSCCLLLTDPVAPTADQVKRAFKSLKTLTDADAVKAARETCGILLKNLSPDVANALQRALQAEGVPTEVVDAARLPKLPDAKFIRRLEIQPQSLAIYDPLGRTVPVPWPQLALVSAGAVRHFGMSATRTEETVNTYNPIGGFRTRVVTHVRHKVEDDPKLMLDIFLTGGAMRFQIEADAFLFKYCFDRADLNLLQKLGLLVQMLAQDAPHAVLNRGATALRDGSPGDAAYVSKAALSDESTWLLWQLAKKN